MIQLEVQSPSYEPSVASSVPVGKSGLVHVWGKNDMTNDQVLIISWVVKDPDGLTVESYSDDAGTIGSLQPHEFIGGRFDLDKEGTYTIAIALYMNRDAPVLVASYDGPLCSTTTEIPPDFKKILDIVYPDGKTYNGPAERATAEFKLTPEQIPGTRWFAEKVMVDKLASEVEKQGGKMLTLKLYENTTPLLWTEYLLVAEATKPTTAYVGFDPVTWTTIILAALIIVGIIVLYFFFLRPVLDFLYDAPGTAIGMGLIALGISAVVVIGIAAYKGTSAKKAVTG